MNRVNGRATELESQRSVEEANSGMQTSDNGQRARSRKSVAEARRKLENYLADLELERNIRDVFDDYD